MHRSLRDEFAVCSSLRQVIVRLEQLLLSRSQVILRLQQLLSVGPLVRGRTTRYFVHFWYCSFFVLFLCKMKQNSAIFAFGDASAGSGGTSGGPSGGASSGPPSAGGGFFGPLRSPADLPTKVNYYSGLCRLATSYWS